MFTIPYKHAPISDPILRTVKTPEPRDMTGKEWKQLFSQWIFDLKQRLRKPDFELAIMRNTMSHKKAQCLKIPKKSLKQFRERSELRLFS